MIKKSAKENIEKSISLLKLILENDWTKKERQQRIGGALSLCKHYISQAAKELQVNPSADLDQD